MGEGAAALRHPMRCRSGMVAVDRRAISLVAATGRDERLRPASVGWPASNSSRASIAQLPGDLSSHVPLSGGIHFEPQRDANQDVAARLEVRRATGVMSVTGR
jgi:hypothetical protein